MLLTKKKLNPTLEHETNVGELKDGDKYNNCLKQ
jgi:hypothetical protein